MTCPIGELTVDQVAGVMLKQTAFENVRLTTTEAVSHIKELLSKMSEFHASVRESTDMFILYTGVSDYLVEFADGCSLYWYKF